jgi:hypothetical protein
MSPALGMFYETRVQPKNKVKRCPITYSLLQGRIHYVSWKIVQLIEDRFLFGFKR